MIRFSVPSDFSDQTLTDLAALNECYNDRCVYEVYGQATEVEFAASGRMLNLLPKVDMTRLESYVGLCRRNQIEFNYTMNASCLGNREFDSYEWEQIKSFLRSLVNIGVSSFTVSLPMLMDWIVGTLKARVKASVLCEINHAGKARTFGSKGIGRLVVDPDITRDFDTLEMLCSEYTGSAEIIVNNMCVRNCPYKMFHYNHEAHADSCGQTNRHMYYFYKCSLQKAADIRNYLQINWIRPEDLDLYESVGIRSFKIQGRHNPNGNKILKTVKHYLDRHFDGNLFDLLTMFTPYNSFQPYLENKKLDGFVKRFFEHRQFCRGACSRCQYCGSYAAKCMNLLEVAEMNRNSTVLYQSLVDDCMK